MRHFLGDRLDGRGAGDAALERYDWPGNVRQLINAVERARIMADEPVLRVSRFSARGHGIAIRTEPGHVVRCQDDLATIERAKVVEVLRREKGNKTRAARTLGHRSPQALSTGGEVRHPPELETAAGEPRTRQPTREIR